MRILGIDFGEKRVGLAVSDESWTLAREFGVMSPGEFFRSIKQLQKDMEVGRVVLGLPLNMSGLETKKSQEVRKFKLKLEALTGLEVELEDERLSSKMAEVLPGGKKNTDSLAAQIILQNYLNRQKAGA